MTKDIFVTQYINIDMVDLIKDSIDGSDWPRPNLGHVYTKTTGWTMQNNTGYKDIGWAMMLAAEKFLMQKVESDEEKRARLISPDLYINAMWGMRYSSNDFTAPHDHFSSLFAAVYYVDHPPGAPGLFFPNLNYEYVPTPGDLIVFPGYLIHEVRPTMFKGYRYTVAANININDMTVNSIFLQDRPPSLDFKYRY